MTGRPGLERVAAGLLLGLLAAAFWRWADRLDSMDNTMRTAAETLAEGQSKMLVRLVEFEGRVLQAERWISRVEIDGERHAARPWHDKAGHEISRLREHIDQQVSP